MLLIDYISYRGNTLSESTHFYQPIQGHGLTHDPFNSIIAPRPIGWISSVSEQGLVNLAPYSFFNAFNYTPPIIGFSSIGFKDSVKNIQQTGEFCWNLVSADTGEAMNKTSAAVNADVDEFELAGLTKKPSQIINVPRVGESKVCMECKLTQLIQLQNATGELCDSWLVLGEVVGVHIHQNLINNGVFDTIAAAPIMRGGGPGDYFSVSEAQKFQMFRPK